MDIQRIIGFAIVGFVIWTIVSSRSQPPPTLAGLQQVRNAPTEFNGWKKPSDGAALVEIRDRSTDRMLGQYVADDDGQLHETDDQRDHSPVKLTVTPQSYLGRWQLDAGALVALDRSGEPAVGIRVSPARILYGTLSPDLVLTERSLGIGGSLYPPKRTGWSRYGVGLWLLHPMRDGGADGLALGITTSFR